MPTIAAAPILVPTGALVIFSDGEVGTVPSGSVAIPTPATGAAGWTPITDEVVLATSVLADAVITIALLKNPIVPSSLEIRSSDGSPFVVSEDGDGGFTGDIGAGPNAIDLLTAIGSTTFGSNAMGPIFANYKHLGTGSGTMFTLISDAGEPLGQGTLTRSNGAPIVVDVTPGTLDRVDFETVDIVVDPDPTAPSLQLSDTNLDKATLELIAAQVAECSALWQTEAMFRGKNVPWIRRASVMQIDELHDEDRALVEIPALLVQNLDIDVDVVVTTRNARALAWSPPELAVPGDEPDAEEEATGDAQTFTDRGTWQPNTSYAEFDAVRASTTLVHMWFIALLQDRGSSWAYPAMSGASNPLAPGGQLPALAEGSWIPDRELRGWWGVDEIVTLTGLIAGQSLRVHDREGVVHYLTYFPDSGKWTDTATPP